MHVIGPSTSKASTYFTLRKKGPLISRKWPEPLPTTEL
jgi:hypothetical protein